MTVKVDHFPIKLENFIFLRPYTRDDADILFHTVDENREHLEHWFPWVKGTQRVEDCLEFLMTVVEVEQTNSIGIHLGIFDTSMTPQKARLLGAVAIRDINLLDHSGAIGCWLSYESQGKGLATMACLKVIEYGKTVLGIERFELHTAINNHLTQALAERLGFKRVPGVIKAAEVIDSKPVDHVVYVLDSHQ